eukprot:263182-Pelagomonas_calceolata.AAC.3
MSLNMSIRCEARGCPSTTRYKSTPCNHSSCSCPHLQKKHCACLLLLAAAAAAAAAAGAAGGKKRHAPVSVKPRI